MALYRKNIGRTHQTIRILLGGAAAISAFLYLSGLPALLVAASGLTFALTGIVGYCPMCAITGIGGRSGS